jgi:hypothetical protein
MIILRMFRKLFPSELRSSKISSRVTTSWVIGLVPSPGIWATWWNFSAVFNVTQFSTTEAPTTSVIAVSTTDAGKGGKAWKGIEQDNTAVMAKVGKTVFLTRKIVSKPTIMAKMIDINRDAIINI